ncbi:hypothetical protein B0H17DRAFT_1193883 [Mycena rosella]|uniref:Uncharacterized protein n=1 Tax=Mycena rosella TaxID=1033263 RepID=A0AAD7GRY8_MYCRO|nr:hypothetical protein B0H17DRAFT_1193883 [Mycena rosella]
MVTSPTELRKRLHLLDAEIAQLQSSLRLLCEANTQHELTLPLLQESQFSLITSRSAFRVRILRHRMTHLLSSLVFVGTGAVAIAMPALWTRMHIELDSDDGRGHVDSKWVAPLDIWLHRSQPHPVSVTVVNRSYTEPDEMLVGVLDRHSPRCRDLMLKLPFNHFS